MISIIKEYDGDSVALVDGNESEVTGIGSVKIKMHDGTMKMLARTKT